MQGAQGRRRVIGQEEAVPVRSQLPGLDVDLVAGNPHGPQRGGGRRHRRGVVRRLLDDVQDAPLFCGLLLDHRRRRPGGDQDRPQLGHDDRVAIHAGAGHQHHEGDVPIAPRHHRGDDAALAMADKADMARVDLGLGRQEARRRVGVVGEVGAGGGRIVAGGGADPALVVAQHRDAMPGQVVGDHREDRVAEHRLVATVAPRAGDQDHGREGARPIGDGQHPGQSHAGALHRDGDLVFGVGPRRGAIDDGLGRWRGAPRQRQGQACAALIELPDPLVGALAPGPIISRPHSRHRETELGSVRDDGRQGNAVGVLVEAVKGAVVTAARRLVNMDRQAQRPAAGLERALPIAHRVFRHRTSRHRQP